LGIEEQLGTLANDAEMPCSAVLVSSDPGQSVEVDFLLLFRAQFWPGFKYLLGTINVPHHRMRACTPAINPTNNVVPIGPDQIGDRNALTFIIIHCLLTSCTLALNLRHGVIKRSFAP
jgi:hypothetical protein